MKKFRIPFVFVITVVVGLLLSSCTGGSVYNTWPGLGAGQGVVYVASHNSVFAVKDGTQVWRFPEKPDNGKSFYAPPSVVDSQVIAADYSNNVYAINAENGSQVWAFSKEGGHVAGASSVVDGVTLVPSTDHHLYALDAQGKQLWSFTTSNILWAKPVSDGTLVYQPGMDHTLYAINLSDGKLAWKKDFGSPLPSSILLMEDGTIYLTSLAGKIYALDSKRQGAVLWEAQVDSDVWATPVFNEDVLYVGSSTGKVFAVSTKGNTDQRMVWANPLDLGSPVIGGGVLFGDKVIFPTETTGVAAIGFDGNKLWNPPVNGKLYTTPVVSGDVVVVAAMEGEKILVAFDSNGTEKWNFTLPK